MLESVPRPEFPTYSELCTAWERLPVTQSLTKYPCLEKLLAQVRRANANDSVVHASFAIGPESTFDYLIATRNFKFLEFPERVFKSGTVRRAMPALVPVEQSPESGCFEEVDPLVLDGELARWLYNGGAYSSARGEMNAADAKQMAVAAVAELFDDRFDEVVSFRTRSAWCDFFFDVAWDVTWVLMDKRKRLVQIICATDTD